MGTTTFSGPVASNNGFDLPISLTAELPDATANTGVLRAISDNGAGNDEFALVVSNGTAWLAVATAALT